MEGRSRASYMPQLTGVRALAAFLVFIHHYSGYFDLDNHFLYCLVHELYIGVTVFFVLSGFLIYYRYADSALASREWVSNYLLNRFARIYPLYFFVLAITFISNGFPDVGELFLHLTLLKGYIEPLKFAGVPQAWTLTVEETFYWMAPLFFFALRRGISLWRLFLGVSLIGLLLTFATAVWLGWSLRFVPFYTFWGQGAAFFAGMGLAWLIQKDQGSIRFERIFSRGVTYGSLVAGILVVLMMGGISFLYQVHFSFQTLPGFILHHYILPVVVALHFYGLLTESTAWRDLLASRLFHILGVSSYAFYLIHIGPFAEFYNAAGLPGGIWGLFLFMHLVSIAAYLTIEKPAHKIIKRKFKRRRRSRANL